jgi:hypothetical protein
MEMFGVLHAAAIAISLRKSTEFMKQDAGGRD